MMGTSRVLRRRLMARAISKPSIPGMTMSRRITAKSLVSSARRASSPDFARIMFWSSELRIASSATRFSSRSSTRRMFAFSVTVSPPSRAWPTEPRPHDVKKVVGVDRFGHIVRGPGLDALLAVSLHRLGGERDDRQVGELRHPAYGLRRRVPVELGHHHIHQHQVDVFVAVERVDPLATVLGVEHLDAVLLQHTREREDVAHVVVHDKDL